MENKGGVFTVVTVKQLFGLGDCATWLSLINRTSVSTIFDVDSLRKNLWTDKDIQLWTETEHDLLILIYQTHITILCKKAHY